MLVLVGFVPRSTNAEIIWIGRAGFEEEAGRSMSNSVFVSIYKALHCSEYLLSIPKISRHDPADLPRHQVSGSVVVYGIGAGPVWEDHTAISIVPVRREAMPRPFREFFNGFSIIPLIYSPKVRSTQLSEVRCRCLPNIPIVDSRFDWIIRSQSRIKFGTKGSNPSPILISRLGQLTLSVNDRSDSPCSGQEGEDSCYSAPKYAPFSYPKSFITIGLVCIVVGLMLLNKGSRKFVELTKISAGVPEIIASTALLFIGFGVVMIMALVLILPP